MQKLNCFILYLFISLFLSQANASIKVTPTLIELNANSTHGNYLTSSFDVQADKNEIIRFKVYPEYFKITSNGTMDSLERMEAPDSLIKYVRFVPNEFTLQNGQAQKVRLTVANLKELPDGESRMVLYLEDVAAKEVILPYENRNVTTKLIIKTRVGIPLYVDKGRFNKTASIEDLKVEKQNKELVSCIKLVSDGNSKVRYQGRAQIIKDKKLVDEYKIKNNVIGSKNTLFSQDEIPISKIKENGDYTLRMMINYTDEKGKNKNLIKETTFTIDCLPQSNI